MNNDTFSIRSRVFLIAILLLMFSSVVLAVFLRDYARRAADGAFDRLLAASALSIAGSVQVEDKQITVELPFASLAMLSGNERVFYTVRNVQGKLVTGYDDLDPGLALATSAVAAFDNVRYHADEVRVSTVGRLVLVNQQAGWITIRVAETRGAREALASEILNRSVLPLVIMVLVALGLLWFGIARAFAPLRLLENELRQRNPDDLQPLASPAPLEVRRLVEALNGFMQRLRAMLGTLNHLVADAAHQVRTPLTSLRAQAEVALEEKDPQRLHERLVRIHLNASRASELVNQLLMDATISHRLGSRSNTLVGVAQIINETRQRIGPVQGQRLHISIAPDVRRARIAVDRIALREMLRNLVDNALRYAPHGDVEIRAERLPGQRLSLTVSDRGPGIPDEEKKRALERFWRGPSTESTPGSGLGLAIVQGVVDAHKGSLYLRNRAGGGLVVTVILPLPPEAGTSMPALLGVSGLLFALSLMLPGPVQAQKTYEAQESEQTSTYYRAPQAATATLAIAGPTDTALFAPLALQFQQAYPHVDLEYKEVGSRELYEQAAAGMLGQTDILISSAVDLQVRLANDGYALRHSSVYTRQLPSWAVWRSEVFGFTFEPVVMVYNPLRFTEQSVPRSRQALLRLLEQEPGRMHGRIGTYDIAASSLGHLLAVQDEMISSNFWGLANAFGQISVQLEASTAAILDKIEDGKLDLGYNVLGSYAFARQAGGSSIQIVLPQDYMLVLARAVLIARHTRQPELAGVFVDWLLSPAGQAVASGQAGLGSVMASQTNGGYPEGPFSLSQGIVQPIALSPVLLVGLDQQRHSRFLLNWNRLVTDTPARPMTGH